MHAITRSDHDRHQMLLFDVDGVLTDGTILVHADGSESKHFNIRDGAGIVWAQRAGLAVGLLSARIAEATADSRGAARHLHRRAGARRQACRLRADPGGREPDRRRRSAIWGMTCRTCPCCAAPDFPPPRQTRRRKCGPPCSGSVRAAAATARCGNASSTSCARRASGATAVADFLGFVMATSGALLLVGLVALLLGLAAGKAWERYKLQDGVWIDRRRARESPHYMLGLNFLVANQIDQAIDELTKAAQGGRRSARDPPDPRQSVSREGPGRARHPGAPGAAPAPEPAQARTRQRPALPRPRLSSGGFVDRAIEAFNEVLKLDPENRYALVEPREALRGSAPVDRGLRRRGRSWRRWRRAARAEPSRRSTTRCSRFSNTNSVRLPSVAAICARPRGGSKRRSTVTPVTCRRI